MSCLGCPCASKCAGKPAAARLNGLRGCSCLGCPQASTCSHSKAPSPSLGFVFENAEPSALFSTVDWTDWKTWVIGALAAALVYELLFSKEKREQRTRRKARRKAAFTAERQRFQSAMRKIRETA
jgi:hypothetical protein